MLARGPRHAHPSRLRLSREPPLRRLVWAWHPFVLALLDTSLALRWVRPWHLPDDAGRDSSSSSSARATSSPATTRPPLKPPAHAASSRRKSSDDPIAPGSRSF